MNAETIILILKAAVIAVTVLFIASLTALARGNTRLHGRINYLFFGLTITAVIGLEVVSRVFYPDMLQNFLVAHGALERFHVHLWFSAPAAVVLFAMLYTGLRRIRNVHIALGIVFVILWTGTFITGVFYLPHQAAPDKLGSLSHFQK